MSLFSGTPRPEEVFTPRSSDVNRRSYVPRPELEEELTEGLTESQHLIIFGESGNGKSWLYKKVFETERVSYQVILGVSEDPKFDVLTSGAGAIQVEA
jgi:predicted GTPase